MPTLTQVSAVPVAVAPSGEQTPPGVERFALTDFFAANAGADASSTAARTETAKVFAGRVIWLRAEQLDRELPFGAVEDLILAIRRPGEPGPIDASGPMLIEAIEAIESGVARLAAETPLLLVAEDVQ